MVTFQRDHEISVNLLAFFPLKLWSQLEWILRYLIPYVKQELSNMMTLLLFGRSLRLLLLLPFPLEYAGDMETVSKHVFHRSF